MQFLMGKNSTASKFGTIRYYEDKNKVKEYSKGIYVKFKPEEVEILHDRMQEAGVQNMSAYIRKMAINGYVIISISMLRKQMKRGSCMKRILKKKR